MRERRFSLAGISRLIRSLRYGLGAVSQGSSVPAVVHEPEGLVRVSSTTAIHPNGGRRRRRFIALALSFALGMAGLAAAATPAHADAVVQITGPAGTVPLDIPFTYTVNWDGVTNDTGIYVEVDLSGMSDAVFTAASYGCSFSGTIAHCVDYTSIGRTVTLTVVATQGYDISANVTAGGDVSGSAHIQTDFGPPPVTTVTSISPDSGPTTGGTTLTITGTNLAQTREIDFGPTDPAPHFSCSDTVCTVVTPPGAPGQVLVAVVNWYGFNDQTEIPYTYTPVFPPGITIAKTVTASGFGLVDTAPFDTSGSGPFLLVAFVSSDGFKAAQTATVDGAGLTWSLAERANTVGGTAEIWTAYASGPLTQATVESVQSTPGYAQMLTVDVFSGASSVGAGAIAGQHGGAPSVDVTTTAANSWVFAVGEDYSRDTAITPGSGQGILQNYLDTTNHDTFWVQNQNQVTAAAGTTVTMGDTAPTLDTWNLAAIEITPSAS
jgi:hypothetical protein